MARKEGNRARWYVSFPVLAVFSAICLVYYTTIFVFLRDLMGIGSTDGVRNVVAFTFLALMCLVSFFAAVRTDPGGVPASFSPETENPHPDGVQLKYCDICCTYKPPRTHHCRVCKRCILKMDHHCVWINNCVGYRNYKPFIIFVLYASVASFYSMVIFLRNLRQNDLLVPRSLSFVLNYVLGGSVVILMSAVLGTLLGWHVYLLFRNMTTIEYRGAVRAVWLAKKSGQRYRHPYNMGLYRNIALVLGPNMLKWLWPTATGHLKDGLEHPVYLD